MTQAVTSHPLITVVREEVTRIPDSADMFPLIVATGPLTSEALSADIARMVGGDQLYFYDAISPIVLAETIRPRQGVPRVTLGSQHPIGRSRGAGLRRGRRPGRLSELPDDA
jgi:hypothetical protein